MTRSARLCFVENPNLFCLISVATLAGLVSFASCSKNDSNLNRSYSTVSVTRGDLPISVELGGSLVADTKNELRLEPKAYRGDLIITKIVAEGHPVKAGDVLIEFDPSSLTDALNDARADVGKKRVALVKAEAELEAWKVEDSRTLERLASQQDQAVKDLAKAEKEAELEFTKKEHEMSESERSLKNSHVDLEQLEQLYIERELHTSTENILIERERARLANAQVSTEETRKKFEIWKDFENGDSIRDKQHELLDKQTEVKKSEILSAATRSEKEAEVSEAISALDRAEKKLANLEADAKSLQIVSPREGVAFYGTIDSADGPSDVMMISFGASGSKELKVGGRVRTHETLITVASMENLSIKMSVMEGDIQHLRPSLPITIRPSAFPALAIKGQLGKVDTVASRTAILSDVKRFTVQGHYEGVYPQLRSGMSCRVTVNADAIQNCLQIPVLAVFSEDGELCCKVVMDNGRIEKRALKIGASNGVMVEIQEGLMGGEQVLILDSADAKG